MSTKPHRLFPHGAFRQLAPNLWIVRGGLPLPLYRNVVVYRLPDGRLVLHSLVAQEARFAAACHNGRGLFRDSKVGPDRPLDVAAR